MKNTIKILLIVGFLTSNYLLIRADENKEEIFKQIKCLDNSSVEIRRSAVSYLGNHKEDFVVPSLIKALDKEQDQNIRYWIIHYLGEFDDKSIIPILVNILINDKEERNTRDVASWSLKLIGDESTIKLIKDKLIQKGKDPYIYKQINEISKQIELIKNSTETIQLLEEGGKIFEEANELKKNNKFEEAIVKYKLYLDFYSQKLKNIHNYEIPVKFVKYCYVLNVPWQAKQNITTCEEALNGPKTALKKLEALKKYGKKEENASNQLPEKYIPIILIKGNWGAGDREFGICKVMDDIGGSVRGPVAMDLDNGNNIFIFDPVNWKIVVYNKEGNYKKIIRLEEEPKEITPEYGFRGGGS